MSCGAGSLDIGELCPLAGREIDREVVERLGLGLVVDRRSFERELPTKPRAVSISLRRAQWNSRVFCPVLRSSLSRNGREPSGEAPCTDQIDRIPSCENRHGPVGLGNGQRIAGVLVGVVDAQVEEDFA